MSDFRKLAGLATDYEEWKHEKPVIQEGTEPGAKPVSPVRRLARLLVDGGFGGGARVSTPKTTLDNDR